MWGGLIEESRTRLCVKCSNMSLKTWNTMIQPAWRHILEHIRVERFKRSSNESSESWNITLINISVPFEWWWAFLNILNATVRFQQLINLKEKSHFKEDIWCFLGSPFSSVCYKAVAHTRCAAIKGVILSESRLSCLKCLVFCYLTMCHSYVLPVGRKP